MATAPYTVLFTDRKKKTVKIADFGLACYVAPGDKVLDAAGVSSNSIIIGFS
jgi:hypothetical protein